MNSRRFLDSQPAVGSQGFGFGSGRPSLLGGRFIASVCSCLIVLFFSPNASSQEGEQVNRTDAEWRRILTPIQFEVTRQKGTEQPFTGKYWKSEKDGLYTCVCCGQELFDSRAKFKSGTGWPSYFQPISKNAVRNVIDASHGMLRTEVTCRRCNAHLGHVFDDGPAPTGLRFCMNSAALKLVGRNPESGKQGIEKKKTYGASSPQELLAKIKSAVRDKSKMNFLTCTCWDRLTKKTQQDLLESELMFLQRALKSARIVSDEKPDSIEGFEYNVPELGFIELVYEGNEKPVRMPFGKFGDRFYLATLVKQGRFPTPQSKEQGGRRRIK